LFVVIFNCVEMQTKGSLSFEYSYDFNTNDVCNWLDTDKWGDTWQNPVLCGDIHVLYSSIALDSKHAHCMIGRELIRFVKEPKKQSWFVIDFKDIKVIPTNYSLKHYITFNTECLRNWKFEPSDDSTDGVNGQWVALINNNNDQLLNQKVATHKWTIHSYVVKNQPFGKFRLFQFGPNSNPHQYLQCSGFKIYGKILSGVDAPKRRKI
ncbi:hypothetical protein RFI_31000, partial [Reticulomyxa filosa]